MDKDKLVRRLKKLLSLAERGVGGEKQNAQRMLDNLLEKHGINLCDITDDVTETHWFKYPRGDFNKRLLFQVIYAVCGKRDTWVSKYRRYQVGVDCTEYERVQIKIQFEAYQQALESELNLAYEAFLQVNCIFPENAKLADIDERDMECLTRLAEIASGMKKVEIRQALPKDI